jgi:hypothetical protein
MNEIWAVVVDSDDLKILASFYRRGKPARTYTPTEASCSRLDCFFRFGKGNLEWKLANLFTYQDHINYQFSRKS